MTTHDIVLKSRQSFVDRERRIFATLIKPSRGWSAINYTGWTLPRSAIN